MSDIERDLEQTKYGFRVGNILVNRFGMLRDNYVILVNTPRQTVQVEITPTGLTRTYTDDSDKYLFERLCQEAGCKKDGE